MSMTQTSPPELSEGQLVELAALVEARVGLSFHGERLQDLARGVAAAARELGFRDPLRYALWLRESAPTPRQLDALAGHLTPGETYFFRDAASFEALRAHVLPELIRARVAPAGGGRRLRIWSAGCSTGEEAYSLAMLLELALPDLERWEVTLLATDVNPRALRTAERGLYREWSFRGVAPDIRQRFFRARPDGLMEIAPHLRRRVSFAYLNLAEDEYPALLNNTNAMDLIMCRNVLMYFTPAQVAKVLARFERALGVGGWLAPSAAEFSMLQGQSETLSAVSFEEAGLLRKLAPKRPAAAAPEREAAPRAAPVPVPVSAPPSAPPSAAAEPALHERALALYRSGDYAAATELAQALLAHRADDAAAMALLARSHANLGRLDAAQEWSRRALAANKLDPVAHYVHANILLELGRRNEASACLARALFLEHDFALAHYTLGMLARGDGKPVLARRHLRNALASLAGRDPQEEITEGEGMTAGRLAAIVGSMSELVEAGA